MESSNFTVVARTNQAKDVKASFESENGGYGFQQGDDALSWFFKNIYDLPPEYHNLLEKGTYSFPYL